MSTRKSARLRTMESRITYKPGYRFALDPCSLNIKTLFEIPCAADTEIGADATIRDAWENPNPVMDLSTERGAVVEALAAALNCAIHETLEWFSLDGQRLVNAHSHEVQDHIESVADGLALWAYRKRKAYPGHPRPVRAGDEGVVR